MLERKCIFSECRRYRFTLWRDWRDMFNQTDQRFVQFIGLNPSTADEVLDDNTITRCINFAKAWGYPAFCMTNLFGWRETDPKKMLALEHDPIGAENNQWLAAVAKEAALVVCAWGNDGRHLGQSEKVFTMLRATGKPLFCLGQNECGEPKHPLYLAGNLKPLPLHWVDVNGKAK